jgi:hypothetical protein
VKVIFTAPDRRSDARDIEVFDALRRALEVERHRFASIPCHRSLSGHCAVKPMASVLSREVLSLGSRKPSVGREAME